MEPHFLETDFCPCCGGVIFTECQCVIEPLITAQVGKVESRDFCHRHSSWVNDPVLVEDA